MVFVVASSPIDHQGPPAHGWSTRRGALKLSSRSVTVRRSLVIAVIVGTILSIINQIHLVLDGSADLLTRLRISANYLVPYLVSTAGAVWAMKTPQ